MAEGGRITGSREEDDLLCCTVCMEEYEDPRALPCLHTFCHKCLVQLSLKEGTISSSDKKLPRYISNIFNVSKQKEVLKCPLCSEEHPVPKDKGVAGFRKDFRIHKLKEKQQDIQTKEITSMVTGTEIEKCSFHPEKKLLFHCENESCKLDICEVCWTKSHDKHTVTLLSKKLKDARDDLRKRVGKNMEVVVSKMEILSQAKDVINEQYDKVKNDLKERRKKLSDHLNTIFDQRLEQLEKQKKLQVGNILDEIESVSALKDSFQDIQNDMDKANVPVTSKTLGQYSQWRDQLLQASSDLDKWSYSYSGVQLHDDKIQAQDPFTVEEAIETTTTLSSHKVLLGDHRETKEPKVQKEVRKPEECDADHLKHLKYVSSFEIIAAIRSIAVSRKNSLYAVNKSWLIRSETSPVKKHLRSLDEEANAVAVVYSKSGTEFIVVLNNQKKMLVFFLQEKQDPVSTYILAKQPDGILASCENIIAYSFNENGKACVSLLSLTNDLPEFSAFSKPLEIPLESGKVRSMHLSISNKGNPVLSCSSVFLPDFSKKSDTAVVMSVISKQTVHCKMSFNELDSNISAFNLKSMTCDKDYVFVLNGAAGGALYRITKSGLCVRKMKMIGKDFPSEFSSVNCICLGSEVKKLYTSNANNTISIFNYF